MNKTLRISIAISLLLHFATAVFLFNLERKPTPPAQKPIEISVIDSEEMERLAPLFQKQMQIVDQSEKSINDDIPDDAKYLSRHNQKVAEETRAQSHGKFNNQAAQGMKEKGKQAQAQKSPAPTPVAPWESEMQKTESGLPTLEALKPKFDWNKMAAQNLKAGVENPGEISATDDYLKDTKTGPQTLLNTREFVYFSYYNRIKNQLQQYWEPKIKAKVTALFRQGRQLASDQDRITRVRITLNDKGVLVGVAVLNESGVEELDQAAVEAFRAAAPFPNPPKGIVDSDGKIKIDWSFILEAQAMPKPQFRAQRRAGL